MMKTSWAEIPSIKNLTVDWGYEPENPLGKRSTVRILKNELSAMLEMDSIPVKLVSKRFDQKGYLIDISFKGMAFLVNENMDPGMLLRVGFFLGRHKVIARGIVRNCNNVESSFRVGIEFVELEDEHRSFITCLNSSKLYRN